MLKTRVGEYIPKWLEIKSILHIQLMEKCNTQHHRLLTHPIESGHKVNVINSFKLIYKNKRRRMLQFELRHCPKAVHFLIKTPLVLISLGIEFCSYNFSVKILLH